MKEAPAPAAIVILAIIVVGGLALVSAVVRFYLERQEDIKKILREKKEE